MISSKTPMTSLCMAEHTVISIARCNPSVDTLHKVERQHAWPTSHCANYMKGYCDNATMSKTRPKSKWKENPSKKPSNPTCPIPSSTTQALQAAISAYTTTSQMEIPPSSLSSISDLWQSRICRTASHELGHCFGIDHCIYHACVMQGSASLSEDVR
jgi:archaemetzincin